ncbi:MAG: beta-galactosidase, partial [Clostridia bacterium]|nr:beta-galactosidase [Clostridia bacterium]
MFKKIFIMALVCIMALSVAGCEKKYSEKDLYSYKAQEFEICGLWAPRQMTEEAFQQYKDAGFNVCSCTNHDEQPRSSENQYYLGSKRTKEVLEICKKVGLDVYIAFGDSWFNRANEGDEYFDGTPFSKHDYYGEYKDIIKGVHINDEPKKDKMIELSSDTLINDFKKVYPDTKYMINLIPETAISSREFESYTEMLEIYGEDIMSKFENPYICVDCYLYSNWGLVGKNIVNNYNQIANSAKKYGAETTFILQSSTGNEFLDTLSEADMRQQAYLAIAFGADNIQYYCYSVPEGMDPQYINCMLERDNETPSQLYYDVKTVNAEIQKFASAVLAYDWQQSIGISGSEDQTYRVSVLEYDLDLNPIKMENAKHYASAKGTQDMVLSRFESEEYGEAYML